MMEGPRNRSHLYSPERETLDPDELDDLIRRRLRYTLEYAAEHSDYWAHRFNEAGIVPEDITEPEELLALAPIDNDDRQPPSTDDFEWPIFHDGMSYHAHCTSGTTGAEKWVFVNEDDEEISTKAVRRGYAAAGLDKTTRLVNFLPKGLYMSGKQSEDAADGYVHVHEAFGHMNTPPQDRVLALFDETVVAPESVFGSPSTVEQLVRELEAYGIDPAETAIETIMVVGEASSEERRAAIADRFDATVTDNYATTELGFTAYASPACDVEGMHVIEDLRLLLVVDEEERRLVDEGERGEVWLSTLYPVDAKGGTPLFNYKPGDLARELGRRACACGRTHRMIADVVRSDNAVEVHQAAKITPTKVENVIHREHYRPVLSGEYVVRIESRGHPRDTIRILVEEADQIPSDVTTVPEQTSAFLLGDKSVQVDHETVEESICEEFLHAHVAFKAFQEGDNIHIETDVVEPGQLPLTGGGKPQRVQLTESKD